MTSVVRVLDSSWDEFPTLEQAMSTAQRMANTFKQWANVYEGGVLTATVWPEGVDHDDLP